MAWIEEESGVKFFCFGELKESLSKDEAVVLKMNESIEVDIVRIDIVGDGDEKQYKYRLNVDGEDKPVIMWSNASIKRQQETLDLKDGEHIRITYVKDYETAYSKKGRQIKIEVDRTEKKKK